MLPELIEWHREFILWLGWNSGDDSNEQCTQTPKTQAKSTSPREPYRTQCSHTHINKPDKRSKNGDIPCTICVYIDFKAAAKRTSSFISTGGTHTRTHTVYVQTTDIAETERDNNWECHTFGDSLEIKTVKHDSGYGYRLLPTELCRTGTKMLLHGDD